MRTTSLVVALVANLVTPASSAPLEVDAGVGGIMYFGCCSWSLRISADGTTVVTIAPASHLSRKFTLSTRQMRELEATLNREDFLSLDQRLGALVFDGNDAQIRVKLGERERTVVLHELPDELLPIWRTDPSQLGRAFRVCEYLRTLTGVPQALRCPGIPEVE